MDYDVLIIGAGMSGLAAGIRLAHFDHRVCLLERHYAYGGLNSYYRLGGRDFDVGLHALTNYVGPHAHSAPLNRLLRQLRISRDEWSLGPQRYSEIRFPGRRLRWTNDPAVLVDEVAREFPERADDFRRFVAFTDDYDDIRLDATPRSARVELVRQLRDPVLINMLLCPTMYYGNAAEHDMDFTEFVTIFKSLFRQGLARPREGVRAILRSLVRRYRGCGGKLRMNSGVRTIHVHRGRVEGVTLDSGETLTAEIVISSAGYHETMALCRNRGPGDGVKEPVGTANPVGADGPRGVEDQPYGDEDYGCISFVESMAVLDERPDRLGHDATIVFFNDTDRFTFAMPEGPVDLRSGVVCCPSNYLEQDEQSESLIRVTWLANYRSWLGYDEADYRAAKSQYLHPFLDRAGRYIPGIEGHVVASDMFTPRTIQRYTGHVNGAVYGSPRKRRDGRTPWSNLFICGTDQGYLGIIGAMLSGVTVANLHVLSNDARSLT